MRKISVFLITLAALPLAAQPVFTADDLPDIGYEATLIQDTVKPIIVDVGTTGGPQTWDFSREVFGDTVPFEVLEPADTPVADSFPDAEFVYHLAGVLQDTITGDLWQYYQTTSTQMLMIGDYAESYSIRLYHDYDPDRVASVFPLQMDAEWQDSYHTLDSLDPFGLFILEMTSSSSSKVDAWGTVIVPADTFDEALRYITYDTTLMIQTKMGTPDTLLQRTINYTWVAAEVGAVVRISSLEDEIDPQFDTAGTYVVLTENNFTPGIEETKMTAPPEIHISDQKVFFHTVRAGVAELDLYDAVGRRTVCLYRGILPSGEHSLPLPADLPRGVYFVRMRTSTESMTGKFAVLD